MANQRQEAQTDREISLGLTVARTMRERDKLDQELTQKKKEIKEMQERIGDLDDDLFEAIRNSTEYLAEE